MRRILAAAWIILSLIPTLAEAQNTTLTTTVPSSHTISVTTEGKGRVRLNGIQCAKTDAVQVTRHSTPSVVARAIYGYKLASITYNGKSVTKEVENGTWIMPSVTADGTLVVAFAKDSGIDHTYTADDLREIARHVSKIELLDDTSYADVNMDGEINAEDLTTLAQLLLEG